jgi:2-polyprenyl-6-methoxyphenol hydroxylase-like FAD-dependent oxidoreductase
MSEESKPWVQPELGSPGPGTELRGRHAIVVGTGITGLAAALVLSKRGARVTLLERDAEPPTATASAAFDSWQRRGAPQVRHSHAFLGRLRTLLRDRHPALLAELLAAGARELRMVDNPPPTLGPLTPVAGDDDLVALGCRRTTFEWVVRRHVLGNGEVALVGGATARGLTAHPGDPPRVTGVRYERDGEERTLAADLVVDASGRHSKAVEWLAAIGGRRPFEKEESSGIVYYTRFYRMHPGVSEPAPGKDPLMADYHWVKFAVFPADDRTFSITLAVPLAYPRLKVLARAQAFDAMVQSFPGLAPWVAPSFAAPIGDPERPVQAMGGLINRLRRFANRQGPLAIGFYVLGDAAYCTNPLYGRGCTQGFLHAEMLGDALAQHPADPVAAAIELDRKAQALLAPFYRASILADRDAVRRAQGRRPRRWQDRLRQRFFDDGITIGTRCDPVVYRAFLRMLHMLETPEEAFAHPRVMLRALRVLARGKRYNRRYALPPPPDRDATIARCEAAGARPGN